MRLKVAVAAALTACLVIAGAVVSAVAWWLAPGAAQGTPSPAAIASAGVMVLVLAFLAGWFFLQMWVIWPAEELARDAKFLAQTQKDRELLLPRRHALQPLPEAVMILARRLVATRCEVADAVARATARGEEQRSRLEAILLDLTEGVIVANLDHRILLYNQSAARILAMNEALGLGRPLFELLTSEPILHVLEQLNASPAAQQADRGEAADKTEQSTRRFVCATVDLGTLLEARLSLVREPSGAVSGYVLTFADAGPHLEMLALRDAILRDVMVEWRRPIANIRAAVEMLASETGLSDAERRSFDEITSKEVETLGERFGEASQRYEELTAGPWPMADVLSLDLFKAVKRHLADSDGLEVTLVGMPVWLHADSHSLMLAIEFLIRRLAVATGRRAFDLEVGQGAKYRHIAITWDGTPISASELDRWQKEPLRGTIANRTVADIIERHGSDLWSKATLPGRAALLMPLKLTTVPSASPAAARSAPRPEYYDFELFRVSNADLADLPLRKINYVVFDTETTGLRPSGGDELIAIGAVRVVNGRLLSAETFERLINPGRPIPKESIQFHGITDDMVRDKPPARIVLPQFKNFVSDATLVAYNAAFDMKFLELKQAESGVRFENPVLDALLLSIYLYPDNPDPSLSGMTRRLGIDIQGRHTALGDALMTAAVWVKLLELLEERGVTTFGEAIRISSRMMKERRMASKF
jgi:DNA polymerase-3 subunit epsilon